MSPTISTSDRLQPGFALMVSPASGPRVHRLQGHRPGSNGTTQGGAVPADPRSTGAVGGPLQVLVTGCWMDGLLCGVGSGHRAPGRRWEKKSAEDGRETHPIAAGFHGEGDRRCTRALHGDLDHPDISLLACDSDNRSLSYGPACDSECHSSYLNVSQSVYCLAEKSGMSSRHPVSLSSEPYRPLSVCHITRISLLTVCHVTRISLLTVRHMSHVDSPSCQHWKSDPERAPPLRTCNH